MLIADMHCDSLMHVSAGRGLLSAYNTSREHPYLQAFAAFIPRGGRSPAERRAELMRRFNAYLYETDRLSISRITDVRELCAAEDSGKSSAIFTVEGGGGLFADSPELAALYKGGLRILGMCWDTNELASGAWEVNDTGLTEEGRRLALMCEELGITLDVSHLSDKSLDGLFEITRYPLIATHSNFRDICPSRRNLTLAQAKKIVARGGIIGLNLYPPFLTDKETATAEDIFRHVDYALDKLGEGALGLGCDIDGTDGVYPEGFDEYSSIHDRLINMLLSHYPAATVERIAGGNVSDFLMENL